MSIDQEKIVAYVQGPRSDEQKRASKEFLDGLLARSASDPAFRQKLVADARGALSEYLGREVPGNFNIKFIEAAAGVQTFVLPDYVGGEAELTEAELETVAGGVTPAIIASCVASSLECAASAVAVTVTIIKVVTD